MTVVLCAVFFSRTPLCAVGKACQDHSEVVLLNLDVFTKTVFDPFISIFRLPGVEKHQRFIHVSNDV